MLEVLPLDVINVVIDYLGLFHMKCLASTCKNVRQIVLRHPSCISYRQETNWRSRYKPNHERVYYTILGSSWLAILGRISPSLIALWCDMTGDSIWLKRHLRATSLTKAGEILYTLVSKKSSLISIVIDRYFGQIPLKDQLNNEDKTYLLSFGYCSAQRFHKSSNEIDYIFRVAIDKIRATIRKNEEPIDNSEAVVGNIEAGIGNIESTIVERNMHGVFIESRYLTAIHEGDLEILKEFLNETETIMSIANRIVYSFITAMYSQRLETIEYIVRLEERPNLKLWAIGKRDAPYPMGLNNHWKGWLSCIDPNRTDIIGCLLTYRLIDPGHLSLMAKNFFSF